MNVIEYIICLVLLAVFVFLIKKKNFKEPTSSVLYLLSHTWGANFLFLLLTVLLLCNFVHGDPDILASLTIVVPIYCVIAFFLDKSLLSKYVPENHKLIMNKCKVVSEYATSILTITLLVNTMSAFINDKGLLIQLDTVLLVVFLPFFSVIGIIKYKFESQS